jgi:hypothetical protein
VAFLPQWTNDTVEIPADWKYVEPRIKSREQINATFEKWVCFCRGDSRCRTYERQVSKTTWSLTAVASRSRAVWRVDGLG